MFRKILEAIRKLIKSFIGAEEKTKPIDVAVSDDMSEAIELWSKMYEDKAPWLSKNVKSLGLASAIPSEFARLIVCELQSEVTGSARADFLNEQYTDFLKNLQINTEYACAKGYVIFKPYIESGRIYTECVQANNCFPLSYNAAKDITGAVFVETKQQGSKLFYRMEIHRMSKQGVVIENIACNEEFKTVPLSSVDEWADIEPKLLLAGRTKPLFSCFRIPLANNIDEASPLGVSVYARAAKLIEEADKQYSRFLWEFEGGELAVDIDSTAFVQVSTATGELRTVMPKGGERLFRRLNVSGGANRDFYNIYSPTLRDVSLLNGLNALLRKIESSVGLAYGTYSEVDSEAKTAEEVRASKQRSYVTVCNIQKSLENAIINLMEIYDFYATFYRLAPTGKYEMSFSWDDSILVNADKEQTVMLQEVQAGILSKKQYLMKRYGVSETEARAMLPQSQGLFGDVNDRSQIPD